LGKATLSTKLKFEKLTSNEIDLDISQNAFSPLICVNCNRDLNKFSQFREDLIRKQTKLYEIVFGEIVCEDQAADEEANDENAIVQEESHIQEGNEETLDEEMMECNQFFVDEESMHIESLVEESDGAEPMFLIESGELKEI
jgi:hypothetical protein